MSGEDQRNMPKLKAEHGPGVIIHIGDQGAASPDPTPCDTDIEPSSALGGGSSTRSNTRSARYPRDEEQ
jgi:hypothetical protein